MSGECCVYVIAQVRNRALCGPVKVGMSANPYSRLAELQTGSPHQLVIVNERAFRSRSDAAYVEDVMRLAWSDCKMIGEWVDASPLRVADMLNGPEWEEWVNEQ